MKVVIDTNVMVSGIFFPGKPSIILKAWKKGLIKPVMTAEIFDEYREVLNRLSRRYSTVEVGPLIDLIAVEIPMVKAARLRRQICNDPDDDKFIACAIAAKTKLIISGDQDLLRVTGSSGIKVLTPAEFVAKYL